MRVPGMLLGAALLLSGCAAPSSPPPDLSPAASSAAAAEFTLTAPSASAPFPTWSTQDLDGYDWNSANLRPHTTIVNFWASWCQPCIDEWPELQAAAASHPSIDFIGINTMDDRAAARRFLKDHPSDYRHLVDDGAFVMHHLGAVPSTTLPTTIILDASHHVVAWKVGPVTKGQIRRALGAIGS